MPLGTPRLTHAWSVASLPSPSPVELAGVLNALGSETHLAVRKHKALREFDEDISDFVNAEMERQGITIHRNTGGVARIEPGEDGTTKRVTCVEGQVLDGVDVVLMAPGRIPNLDGDYRVVPNVQGLHLDRAGVKQHDKSEVILVDEFQNTNVDNIFALGDVCGEVELTPMVGGGCMVETKSSSCRRLHRETLILTACCRFDPSLRPSPPVAAWWTASSVASPRPRPAMSWSRRWSFRTPSSAPLA